MIVLKYKLFSNKSSQTKKTTPEDKRKKLRKELNDHYDTMEAKGQSAALVGMGAAGFGLRQLIAEHPEIIKNKKGNYSTGKMMGLALIPVGVGAAGMIGAGVKAKNAKKRDEKSIRKVTEITREELARDKKKSSKQK